MIFQFAAYLFHFQCCASFFHSLLWFYSGLFRRSIFRHAVCGFHPSLYDWVRAAFLSKLLKRATMWCLVSTCLSLTSSLWCMLLISIGKPTDRKFRHSDTRNFGFYRAHYVLKPGLKKERTIYFSQFFKRKMTIQSWKKCLKNSKMKRKNSFFNK